MIAPHVMSFITVKKKQTVWPLPETSVNEDDAT